MSFTVCWQDHQSGGGLSCGGEAGRLGPDWGRLQEKPGVCDSQPGGRAGGPGPHQTRRWVRSRSASDTGRHQWLPHLYLIKHRCTHKYWRVCVNERDRHRESDQFGRPTHILTSPYPFCSSPRLGDPVAGGDGGLGGRLPAGDLCAAVSPASALEEGALRPGCTGQLPLAVTPGTELH